MSGEMNFDDALAHRLMSQAVVDRAALERGQALAISKGLTLDRALLRLGLLDEELLLPELALVLDLPFTQSGEGYRLDPTRLQELTPGYCSANAVAPVLTDSGQCRLMLSDPGNAALVAELRFYAEEPPEFTVAPLRLIRGLLSQSDTTNAEADRPSDEQQQVDQQTLAREEADGPVIRFVSECFNAAVSQGASDIHIESQEAGLRIRLRVDGLLQNYPVNASLNPRSILARVKVLAAMNVSERRLPQDGRITLTIGGRKVDFRVSSIPTSYGESIVCRVLDPKALRIGWEQLGFSPEITRQIIAAVEQPSGLFLVTGPTGSGKTTTLYTALAHLNREDRKILTVEDPVEYNLAGVEQVQVHEEIGMGFARALRAFLRQDPNVIMIGEIRDQETAEIACRAALVGRMVLSTLHTNSPEGAVTRLVDLGVPEYIVRDVLRGVLGQRLKIGPEQGRRLQARFVGNRGT